MNKIEIFHKETDEVIFQYETENNTIKKTVEEAVRQKIDLRGANLHYANLTGANLEGANLYKANLYDANLKNANLYNADLRNADLRDADLQNANLYNANLTGADLEGTKLDSNKLKDAKLDGVRLIGDILHNNSTISTGINDNVIIKWQDSYYDYSEGWNLLPDDYKADCHTITSYGKIVYEDDKVIAIAHNITDKMENMKRQVNGIMVIPQKSIVEIKRFPEF